MSVVTIPGLSNCNSFPGGLRGPVAADLQRPRSAAALETSPPRHPCVQQIIGRGNLLKQPVSVFLVLVSLLVAALTVGVEARAEGAGSLKASFDRTSARIGETVVLSLGYTLPEGGTLPEPPQVGGVEGLTILGRETVPNGIALKVLVDQLEALKTGPLVLVWLDKEKKPQKLYADSVKLQAASNLGEKPAEAQLRPPQDIVPVRPPWLRYLPWALGLLALLLVAAGLYWWWKKRRRQSEIAQAAEAPHVWASREVQRLEAQKVFEKGKVKEFYFRLSEIMRRYLEAIRGFPAAEYTVEEIARSVSDERDRQLLVLLRQADLVKFADVVPTAARKEEEVQAALAYIGATTPRPESPPAGPAPARSRR